MLANWKIVRFETPLVEKDLGVTNPLVGQIKHLCEQKNHLFGNDKLSVRRKYIILLRKIIHLLEEDETLDCFYFVCVCNPFNKHTKEFFSHIAT